MFIFQHISSFISLIHPLSAVFISEETECRTFVIEKQIDFIFNFQLSIFNYQIYGFKLQRVLRITLSRKTSRRAYATAQINGELSLKQLSRRYPCKPPSSRADVVAVLISTVERTCSMPSRGGNRWISANWVNSAPYPQRGY